MFRPYMAIIRVFSFPLRFRYINCDVEISHPIIILVCLCIGGYYITSIYIYIYIYIYILSLLVGVISSWGCQLDVNLLFRSPHRNLYSETLREKEKPDDGHIRPKHVVLLLILEYTSFI